MCNKQLTPIVAAAIAKEFGYVTRGQAADIEEACEHYINGKTVQEAVIEVTGECSHNWVSTSPNYYECTMCGDTK